MATAPSIDPPDFGQAYAAALLAGAAPGETEGLDDAAVARAGALAAATAAERRPGAPVIRLENEGEGPGRRMALAVVNDDMPFLVDSVSLAVTAAGLSVDRLLHPVVDVRRDAEGRLLDVFGPAAGPPPPGTLRESVMWLEIERAGAAARAKLVEDVRLTLADVRAAVADWQPLLRELRRAARGLQDNPPPVPPHALAEDVAFLEWIAADNFTVLGWRGYRLDGDDLRPDGEGLGVLRDPHVRAWDSPDGRDLPEPVARFVARAEPLVVAKCDLVATVHRRVACDYISVKRHDPAGRTVGEDRFVGLFTSAALSQSPRQVPLLRRRVGQVIADLGFDPRGHNGKALIHVMESFPRDELFQVGPERLREMALGLVSLADRPRPKLFIRTDPFGRQVSALVYVPRDVYTGELRVQLGAMLEREVGAGLDRYDVELRSEGLARVHYVFGLQGRTAPPFDEAALNRRLTELVRGWDEALETALIARVGPMRAARVAVGGNKVFSASYRAQFSAEEAAEDVERLLALGGPDEHDVRLYRRMDDGPGRLRLKIYRPDELIALSDAVPVLERFGFKVIEEYPFDADVAGRRGYIHDFLVELPGGSADAAALGERAAPALKAVLDGDQENDVFNALVLACDLDRGGVAGTRAYYRYLRQAGLSYAQQTVVDALSRNPQATRDLAELFRARFDPARERGGEEAVRARVVDALAAITSIDDDRIIRTYLAVIEATLRTNVYAPGGREALAYKIDSARVPGLPRPVPHREIWVYSPRVEGIHLRGGPVARGGLRWSDRRDDFRTEVLGLMKAQLVKNAVIVPTGAKGGFYPKQLPPATDREAWLAEGTECYRVFIRALLSVTDNIVDDAVVPPEHVVRHDGDDPYLVVAADKGTATFSDVANAISLERDFWLGDAFASGGSVGYDHKAMGITARGAWVAVQRHFAELGRDVQSEPITVVGVGDMSGDVFGNGMLLSRALKLVAAFDHRHVFLDPDPDPETSWAERKRLFDLPRSSWADYDTAKISSGGGVYPRSQKSIPLSPQVRAALGVEVHELGPAELIHVILRAPVDLLWFGGIGTYLKAEAESHGEVGDRANDPNRVDAEGVRAKVIGEGANLAITQAGRVAFARRGGRINTDFIDNSAGVDTSDHEVNIKIAMQPATRSGALLADERRALLADMTDAVAALVLDDNRLQTLALSIAEVGGAARVPAYARVMQTLEDAGRLDRAVEGLPGDDLLAQRAQAGAGLARPELAVLLSHGKMALQDALERSAVVDDPLLERDLVAAFPAQLSQRLPGALQAHRLRREILATSLANELVNRGGITLAPELAEEMGVDLARVAGAFLAARELFGLSDLWAGIDALPPGKLHVVLHVETAGGLRAQMADILRACPADGPSAIVAGTREGVARVEAQLDCVLRPEPRAALQRQREALTAAGAPPELTERIVRLHALDGAIATSRVAREIGASEVAVAEAYTSLGQRLGLDWAKGRAATMTPADPWERLLVAAAERDFETMRFDLIRRVAGGGRDPVAAAEAWADAHPERAARVEGLIGRARSGAATTSAMLAHIAAQARAALAG